MQPTQWTCVYALKHTLALALVLFLAFLSCTVLLTDFVLWSLVFWGKSNIIAMLHDKCKAHPERGR